jgi:signal transduction histidine kinase
VFTRIELAVGAGAAVWAAAFLAGEAAALAFAPLLGLATLPYRRRPVAAALAVAAVTLTAIASGVSEESPASLGAGLTVTYALGRYAAGPAAYAPVLALAAALIAVDGFTIADAVFVTFVLTATWTCGRLVRRRTEHAAAAAATAATLAAQDPDALAAAVVAEERARLAGDALAVVRAAVEAMRAHAVTAERDLDPVALAAIEERGRGAVAELRRLLGLLRSAPQQTGPDETPGGSRRDGAAARPPGERSRRALPWPAPAVAAVLALLAVLDVAAWHAGAQPGAIGLTVLFAAAVALTPADPAAACLAAAVPSLLAAAFDAPLAYGFSTALAAGVLAWSAAADGRARSLVALAVLVAVTFAVARADSPGNEGILLGSFGLTALAGHTWGRRDREGADALSTAERLRAEHEAAAERAVRAERLRLARELHDVASHAVGAMMLQAGAAAALRERDPGGARAAVRTVQAAGTEALTELEVLFGLLDAGAVGPAGLAAPRQPGELGAALEALAARMRAGGLEITLDAPARLDDPVAVATAYRVVQEALTNAARHAPRSRVDVVVAERNGRLAVTVRDDGAGAESSADGAGFGLVGLAERVRGSGGELAAGPAPGGGFAVEAQLPIGTAVA